MQKPTSLLNFEIMQFVMHDDEVLNLLHARDTHPYTFGIEMSCKFHSKNLQNPALSSYIVDFIYDAKQPANNINDDISIMVEVLEGNPAGFKILGIKKY